MSQVVKPTRYGARSTRRKWLAAVLAGITVNAAAACALTSASADAGSGEAATAKLPQVLGVPPSAVTPSPISGVVMVERHHAFIYVSADGRYEVDGDLIDRQSHRNLTEDARRADRLNAVTTMDAITFAPAAPDDVKHVVTVFVDVDCGYCRRLHSEMADYNEHGITVRYLAWPRSGPGTASWKKAESVWCAKDRAAALTAATLGQAVSPENCVNAVAAEYELGVALGVHGTPTMILPDGSLSAGYLPPDQLAAKLEAMTPDQAKEVSAH
jgi:thiol:disulfide interchange protein DsbC